MERSEQETIWRGPRDRRGERRSGEGGEERAGSGYGATMICWEGSIRGRGRERKQWERLTEGGRRKGWYREGEEGAEQEIMQGKLREGRAVQRQGCGGRMGA